MANMERVNAVLDDIAEDLSRWNQGTWFAVKSEEGKVPFSAEDNWCGTTGCFAGHGSMAAGYRPVRVQVGEGNLAITDNLVLPRPVVYNNIEAFHKDHDALMEEGDAPKYVAQRYFELTDDEADSIFLGIGATFEPGQFDEFREYVTQLLTNRNGRNSFDIKYVAFETIRLRRAEQETLEALDFSPAQEIEAHTVRVNSEQEHRSDEILV